MLTTALCLLFTQNAIAVPIQMNHQGRLLDADSEGLSGSHELIFHIMDDLENGDEIWTEIQTVQFINGYYSVLLGVDEELNPLDDSVFANYPLYLELNVDGEILEPRHPMGSVPYAQIAGVAESVDGGTVNANEVLINGTQVIDDAGNWVGTAPAVDFADLDNVPAGLDDGDDDTLAGLSCTAGELAGWNGSVWGCVSDNTLDLVDVENMLLTTPMDLNVDTTIDGLAIVTTITDSDVLAALGCGDGEVAKYDSGGSVWACGADIDTVLDEGTVETYITNGALDLSVTTTIGGLELVTTIDDSDTLADLSCVNDGEIARYDLALDEWYCDADIDTVLDEATVETYVTNGALDLYAGTTLGGNSILTGADILVPNWSDISGMPADFSDGVDDNTQLNEIDVEGYITNGTLDLHPGTTMSGNNILTDADTLVPNWYNISGMPADFSDGVDDNTQLNENDVEGYITNGTLDLHPDTTINGMPIATESGSATSSGLLVLQPQDVYSVTTSNSYPSAIMQIFAEVDGLWSPIMLGSTCGNCGDGSDGVYSVLGGTTSVTLAGGTYNYESFEIPNGVTLTVTGTSPLIIKSQTTINIEGDVIAAGGNASNASGGTGVAGGSNGTNGSYASSSTQMQNGSGGTRSSGWNECTETTFSIYGGGGGTGGRAVNNGGGGGAGGGAIILVARSINISGMLDVSGGAAAYNDAHSWVGGEWGGGGAGGSVWISTTGFVFTGTFDVSGGSGGASGQSGTIRIDAPSIQGSLTETCDYDDLANSYRNGFANTLEANFVNGTLSINNNTAATMNAVVNVLD